MDPDTRRSKDAMELQRQINMNLKEAMVNERSKRWHKVIQNYRRLLMLLSRQTLGPGSGRPPWLTTLLYETHYHLGIAYQHVGEHQKAVQQYSKAIDSVFIPKNGCQAGCNSNSCLMTPMYARRALAHALAGDLRGSIKDAEKAVVLDNKNPDVYSIRAMARSTRGEINLSLPDVDKALKYNSSHLCALILKGCLAKPAQLDDDWIAPGKEPEIAEHVKACSINPDTQNYLDVRDFKHPEILTFYARFLYSLSVPHTISDVQVVAPHNGSTPTGSRVTSAAVSRAESSRQTGSRVSWHMPPPTPEVTNDHVTSSEISRKAFRCGTPVQPATDQSATRRRHEYAEAVRQQSSKSRTTDDYIASLTGHRLKRQLSEHRLNPRAHEAGPGSKESVGSRPMVKASKITKNVNMRVAPRMYYRPWLGDKLPVADLEKKQWIDPPFKV